MENNSSFDTAFAVTMGIEGGYTNNPADPGGATMYGVTERVARKAGYTGRMQDLPLALAKAIAKGEYWNPLMLDQLPPAIAAQLFDIQYNGGHAAQWLQSAVGVKVDGVIGAVTVAKVRSMDQKVILMRVLASRARYYASLKNPVMINGWVNRLATMLEEGAKNG